MFRAILIVVCVLCHATPARAAIVTYRGTEKDFWNDKSVVLAEVVTVVTLDKWWRVRMTLDVQATLSGQYDAATHPQVEATFETMVMLVKRWPLQPKDRVVVVLQRLPGGQYRIPTSMFTFMPQKQPIAVITSLHDEAVQETIARLREVRITKAKSAKAGE